MMKKSKKVILILLIIFQLMNLIGFQSFSIEKDSDGVTLVTEDNTYKKTKFYKPNLFGIAGGFHLVGFNSIHTGSHVNGNILTKTLNYGSNFGTKGVEEISYIQDRINGVQGFQGTADTRSVIVVGKNINTGVADNGNAWSINGSKIDKPEKRANLNSLWKDSSSKFIDIDLLEKEMIDLSRTLSNHKNNAIYIENSDHNRQTIRIENSEVFNVYNLKNGDFNFSNDINIYGFDKSKPTTLVINVDMKEFGSTFSLKKSIAHYTDGSTAPTGEVKTWQNANVVWNIYDSSQPDGVFNGYITNNDTITGILLSPGADANMTKNFNGTIIAKNITNSGETHRDDYVPTNTEIAVSKVWEGKAKEEVEVSLLADGKEIDKISLNDKNDWKHIFKDLPIVDENTNKKINYTVKEKKIEGYESNIEKNGNGFVITNIENKLVKLKEIPVKKVWQGKAKEEVEVSLLADGKEVDKIILNDKNDWKHIFKELPIINKETNKEIVYTMKEKKVEGYKSEIKENKEGFVIINTEEKEIEVEKVWQGKAKEEVEVSLLADGKEVDKISLNDKNSWKHVFKKLPAIDKETNKEINYTVKEKKVDGYGSKIEKSKTGFVITNMEEKEIEVEKVWQGKAKEEVEVSLLADGKEVDKISLNDKNSWKHIFKKLPAVDKETNKEINYTVKEKKVDGYESKIEKSKTGFVITNMEEKEIEVEKVWQGKAKEEVEVSLLADGKEVDKISLNDKNSWKHIFKNLPAIDKETNKEINYTVKEKKIEGYESKIEKSKTGFVITNTENKSPKLKEIPVEKVWVGTPKDEIEVSLLADGKEVEKVILNKENNWKYIFKDLSSLDKETGKEIIYSVKEKIIEGYESSISEKGNGFVITNTEKESPKLKEIPVEKVWVGIPKDEIEVSLLADGKEVEKVILNKENNWKYIFKDLSSLDKETGKEIIYSVKEKIIEGYESSISEKGNGFVITNTEKESPKLKEIPVRKVWKGRAKEEVEISLLADGKEVEKIILNKDNNWKHVFKNLPIRDKETDKEINYTIREKRVSGYRTEIKKEKDGFVVINTKRTSTSKSKNIPVKKIWKGKAKDKVEIALLADGKEVGKVTLNSENDWEHIFRDLPIENRSTGREIKYTVKEKEISGYDSEIKEISDGFIVINTESKLPKLTQVPVKKIWYGKVQNRVEISLFADGKKVDEVILNNKNDWEHTFKNLPTKNEDTGKEIKYTVKEKEISGYDSEIKEVLDGFIITNTENGKPKLTQIPVAKVWNGKAQSQVEIRLLADGKEVDNVILNNKNKWIHIFEGLPLENDTGKEIKYTVSEKEVVGYKSDIRMVRGAFIVTNTELDENEKKTTNANNISNIKTSNPKTYDKGILSSIIILIFATIGMIFILKIKKDK